MVPGKRFALLMLLPLTMGAAAALSDAMLWPMIACDLAVAIVALIDALRGRAALVSVEREAPAVLSVGRRNPIRLVVRSRADRPLQVQVTDDPPEGIDAHELPLLATVPARGEVTLTYHLHPSRRGAYVLGDHHVRTPTPWGLWQRQQRFPARSAVKVYPDLQAVRTYELLARQNRENAMVRAVRLRGGENEFERLREYQRDDEYRAIDWKATARRQKLIAREYQQERNQSILCLLDTSRLMTGEVDGLSQLDHALNAVLMMSHVAARSGDQVGLCAFDSEVRTFLPPAGGPGATRRLIRASYDLEARMVEANYDAAFEFVKMRQRKRALVILFTQVIDDVSAQSLRRQMRGLTPTHLPLAVLFRDGDVDALAAEMPTTASRSHAGKSDVSYTQAAAAELILWQDRLISDLKGGGGMVLNPVPRSLTPHLINRYLEIKAQHLL